MRINEGVAGQALLLRWGGRRSGAAAGSRSEWSRGQADVEARAAAESALPPDIRGGDRRGQARADALAPGRRLRAGAHPPDTSDGGAQPGGVRRGRPSWRPSGQSGHGNGDRHGRGRRGGSRPRRPPEKLLPPPDAHPAREAARPTSARTRCSPGRRSRGAAGTWSRSAGTSACRQIVERADQGCARTSWTPRGLPLGAAALARDGAGAPGPRRLPQRASAASHGSASLWRRATGME